MLANARDKSRDIEEDSMFHNHLCRHFRRGISPLGIAAILLVIDAGAASAIVVDLDEVAPLHPAVGSHIDQTLLTGLVTQDPEAAFETAFEVGDEMFETVFHAVDGVGANVGGGQRVTRVPRADLRGGSEWFNHKPARETGPNASNCNACHNQPFDDAAGNASANVHRDPLRGGVPAQFIQRNTPHLFAPGAVQRLAEEMSAELRRTRSDTIAAVCSFGSSRTASLNAKG